MNIQNRFYLHTSDFLCLVSCPGIAHLCINMYVPICVHFLDTVTATSPVVTCVGSFGTILSSNAISVKQEEKPNHLFPERAFHTSPSLSSGRAIMQQLALIRLHRHKLSPTGLMSPGLCCHLKCWHEDGRVKEGVGGGEES